MMNTSLTEVLAPMVFLIIWTIFTFSENLVPSLVTLLLASLVLPLIFMEYLKLFWPCGLLLILMSTGLIVIFAYIVSLHQKDQKTYYNKIWAGGLMGSLMILMNYPTDPLLLHKIIHPTMSVVVSLALSLMLISLLLFLVVSFIRIVYSKGGGFRKKF